MSSKSLSQNLIEACATGLYLGKLPKAPGTFGTLLGVPVAFLFLQLPPVGYLIAAVVLVFIGAWIAHRYEAQTSAHDPGEVVIDEVAGYVIAMVWLPVTWQSFVAAFVVFRFFDIVKPFPINRIDQKVTGGMGTMLDDVAAGIIANVILQIVYTQTDWLGVKLYAS